MMCRTCLTMIKILSVVIYLPTFRCMYYSRPLPFFFQTQRVCMYYSGPLPFFQEAWLLIDENAL